MSESLLKKIVRFVSEYAYRIRAKQIHKANFTSLDKNGTAVAFRYFDDGLLKYEKWDIDTLMENYSLGSTN